MFKNTQNIWKCKSMWHHLKYPVVRSTKRRETKVLKVLNLKTLLPTLLQSKIRFMASSWRIFYYFFFFEKKFWIFLNFFFDLVFLNFFSKNCFENFGYLVKIRSSSQAAIILTLRHNYGSSILCISCVEFSKKFPK
jgi:hypothetical protein